MAASTGTEDGVTSPREPDNSLYYKCQRYLMITFSDMFHARDILITGGSFVQVVQDSGSQKKYVRFLICLPWNEVT